MMTETDRMQEIRERNKRFWEADTDFLLQQLDQANKTIAEQAAEIERLRSALEGFVRWCSHCYGRGTIPWRKTTTQPEMECLTCRWARQALEASK
jgi:hypothetical protein